MFSNLRAAAYFMFSLLLGFGYSQPLHAEASIALYFHPRPPYLMAAADGTVTGLVGTPATRAFKAANIPYSWSNLPTNRQLVMVEKNIEMGCAVGWFKTPEREKFAKFGKAFYRDAPTVALANKSFQPPKGAKLAQVLGLPNLHVLVKDNYSYGPLVDGMLAGIKSKLTPTTDENTKMVKLIAAGQADFMFVAAEEASVLIDSAGAAAADIHLIKFPDAPDGETRHLMCSKQVPDDVIKRLDQAFK